MKALSIDRPGVAQLVDRPHPVAGPGEVLLQVAFAGLCGTDLSAFLGKNPNVEYPRVIGHEISGRVVDIGPGVDRRLAGRRRGREPLQELRGVPGVPARPPNACREQRDARRATRRRAGRVCRRARLAPGAVAEPAARCARAGRAVLDRHARGPSHGGHVARHRAGAGLWRRRRRRHRRGGGAWARASSAWTSTRRSSSRPVASAPRRWSTAGATSPSRCTRSPAATARRW